MSTIDRRELLLGAASVAVAASTPGVAPAEASVPQRLAYFVGTPGEFDWQFFAAESEEAAKSAWMEYFGPMRCESPSGDDDHIERCWYCELMSKLDTHRHEQFDGREAVSSGDWIEAGLGTRCERCEEECCEDNAESVNGLAVCHDCLALAEMEEDNER